jgi:hypothetical protein
MAQAPIAALRTFIRPRASEERCDTCGAGLPKDHRHTFDPASRLVRCACGSCEILYGSAYRPIPQRVRTLRNFVISDGQWDDLMIPISLAFFSFSTPLNKVIAQYPGPAGAAESLLRLNAWEDICAANFELRELQPDVEALLVNRVGASRDYFIVPIDECYKLVGLIRTHWRGLSGGSVVWGEIANFFYGLQRKADQCPR